MPRELKVLDEGAWFLGRDSCDGYPVSYRYCLCYSLRHYLQACEHDEAKGRQALERLREKIKEGASYKEADFTELLPLKGGGFVVIDQADGMFPLVLYPDGSNAEPRRRVRAFAQSVKDVIDKYDATYRFLRAHSRDVWDEDFQKKLWDAAGFHYPVGKEVGSVNNA